MRTRQLLSVTLSAALLSALLVLPGLASASGGVSWAERMIPGLKGEIRSVEWVDADRGFVLEYDTSNTLWATENGGDTWTHSLIWPTGMAILFGDSFEIKDVDFAMGGLNGWAVGVFKHAIMLPPFTEYSPIIFGTTNGGKTWTNQTPLLDTSLTGEGALNAVHWVGGTDVYACGENGIMLATARVGDDPPPGKSSVTT
ncbi:MAG: hypothetical protein Q8K89_06495 [Actinomycetota bacterium]|nr:hypothetical protein [Actinomycetota bacterium]